MMRLHRFACLVFCCGLLLNMLQICSAQSPPLTSDESFPAFEHWKTLVIAGDSAGLKLLYSTNPVAQVATASGTVDIEADVRFWISLKARTLKADIVQNDSPKPGTKRVIFQAEVQSAAAEDKTYYITDAQVWQQQGQDWRLVVTKRTEATRLRQPVTDKKIYDADADAQAEIKEALAKAGKDHKRLLIVFGANWCYDCHVLDLAFERSDIAPVLATNFELVHVDIGQGDRNQDLMQKYEVPADRGIPAIAVLDSSGKLLYSQQKGEFEKARSLAPEDVLEVLNKWKPEGKS